jgi:hypothetical protein
MQYAWAVVASPAASICFGLLGFLALVIGGRHRDGNKRTVHSKIAMSVLQSAALYTMLVCTVGHWFFKIPLSVTVRDGFGDERVGWLMLALSIDLVGRLYSLYDPD